MIINLDYTEKPSGCIVCTVQHYEIAILYKLPEKLIKLKKKIFKLGNMLESMHIVNVEKQLVRNLTFDTILCDTPMMLHTKDKWTLPRLAWLG